MSATILAVDIGSSSVRAMLCDRHAVEIPGTYRQITYQFDRTPDGGATLDPDHVCDAAFACIDHALANGGSGLHVARVAVDTFVTSLTGVDAAGKPVMPLYTWADARGGDLLPALRSRLDPDAYHQRTGCFVHASYWPLRLVWLREHHPEAFGRARRWLSLGAYLSQRISGRAVMSVSDATWTGLLNRHAMAWDAATLEACGLSPDVLPEITAEPLTGLRGEFAARWPALRDAAWMPAIGDGVASNIGMGCTLPGQVALSLGTSGALRVIVPAAPPTIPDGLFCYRIDAVRSLLGGALSNVGSVYHWLRQTLNFEAGASVESLLAALPPDGHGLTLLPYLTPERSPHWDSRIPAALMGMTGATTPLNILRAGLESVAYGFARIAAHLTPLLPADYTITAGGTAVESSPVLMQLLADVLARPVSAAPYPQATLSGAALFAGGDAANGAFTPRIYTPDAARTAVYAVATARQDRLLALFREGGITE